MSVNRVQYDIIFTGGGAAGLSLCYRGLKAGTFSDKQILIIDSSTKTKNDKTWCFWQDKVGPFEEVVHKQWQEMSVFSHTGKELMLDAGAFAYKMIRSIDFYSHCLDYLRAQPNVTFLQAEVNEVKNLTDGNVEVTISAASDKADNALYKATTVFNSIYKKPNLKNGENYFLQHFLGHIIRLPESQYQLNPNKIHLMDFRVPQEHGTAFMYLLPLHNNEVMVEYTLFTKSLLKRPEYEAAITEYLHTTAGITDYKLVDEEFGIIPMTDGAFQRFDGGVVNIGSAGGDTRGSSGYTFTNIQRTVSSIIKSYQENNHPFFPEKTISNRHQRYDSTLLKVLENGKYKGHEMFTDMFSNSPAHTMFRFMDGTSTLKEDLKVMASLKPLPFLKPFLQSL